MSVIGHREARQGWCCRGWVGEATCTWDTWGRRHRSGHACTCPPVGNWKGILGPVNSVNRRTCLQEVRSCVTGDFWPGDPEVAGGRQDWKDSPGPSRKRSGVITAEVSAFTARTSCCRVALAGVRACWPLSGPARTEGREGWKKGASQAAPAAARRERVQTTRGRGAEGSGNRRARWEGREAIRLGPELLAQSCLLTPWAGVRAAGSTEG